MTTSEPLGKLSVYIETKREKIMKIGYRSPSLSKSLKARTTGRLKRQMKKAVNPLYGKKGMGLINNPQKAIYNKVYNKVTIDPLKDVKKVSKVNKNQSKKSYSTPKQATVSKSQTRVIKTVTYKCNKWIYILLAIFLGYFGAQYFYSGQKRKGFIALLFCLTGIPMLIGFFHGISALFKPVDEKGNITIKVNERANKYQFISEKNKIQKMLSEIEELEPILKNTLDPREYIETVKKIADNLNKVTDFPRMYANSTGFDAKSMANGLKLMVQGLDEEEEKFIRRYYSENASNEGKKKIMEYIEYFSPNAKILVDQLYN